MGKLSLHRRTPLGFGRTTALITLACVALIAVLWAFIWERVNYERRDAIEDVVRQNNNLAFAFEEQTLRALKSADQALLYMKREYEHDQDVLDLRAVLPAELFEDLIVGGFIADARGNVMTQEGTPSGVSIADREFFSYHRQYKDGGLWVSAPFLGRVSHRTVISLSRRISEPGGSFGGVAVVGVDPNYFLNIYRRFDLGQDAVVQLVDLNGIALARRHGDHTSFGNDMSRSQLLALARAKPSGGFVSRGNADGFQRYISYRRLTEHPLVVAVGTSTQQLFAPVDARKRNYYAAAGLMTALLVFFAAAVIVVKRREEKSAADARESEQRFRQIAENIRDVFFLQDVDFARIHYVSPAYEKIWGRTCESLYANPRSWADAIHPDDLPYVLESTAAGRDSTFDHVFRILRPAGEPRWIHVRGFAIRDEAGAVYRTAGVATDITERKLAEQAVTAAETRYRVTFEQAAVGIAHADPEGRFIKANRRFCEMLGYEERELLQRRFSEFTHPSDVESGKARVHELVAGGGQTLPEYEKRFVRKDGTVLWTIVAISVVRDSAGRPEYFIGLVQDITARKGAEAQLHEQLEELRRFQRVTVGRELRMIELEEELQALKSAVNA